MIHSNSKDSKWFQFDFPLVLFHHTLIKIESKQYQPLCLSQSNDVPYNIIICVTLI